MQASKVRVSPDNLNNSLLSRKQKASLRRKVIYDYIRSKPAGTPIRTTELIDAVMMKYQNGWAFIEKMVREGRITREKIPNTNTAIYTVSADGKTVTPARSAVVEKIIADAKEFAWKNNSNDLREFIRTLEES